MARRRTLVVGWVLLAALVGCTSGDETGPTPGRQPSSACADRRETISADVDGDGQRDVVWREYVGREARTELVVGVCTARVSTTVPVGGMGEGEFGAIDIDQDGRSEIVSGGTTVSQSISELLVFRHGRLSSVPGLLVTDGAAQFTEVDGQPVPSVMEDWGCDDLDGDGTRDLVLASATRQTAGAAVHFEAYRIVDATAQKVGARDHLLDHMPDYNERLLSPC